MNHETKMIKRTFDEFTREEAERAMYGGFLPHIVAWLEAEGIQAGSTAFYDLYGAIQRAVMAEWEKAQEARKNQRRKVRAR